MSQCLAPPGTLRVRHWVLGAGRCPGVFGDIRRVSVGPLHRSQQPLPIPLIIMPQNCPLAKLKQKELLARIWSAFLKRQFLASDDEKISHKLAGGGADPVCPV